ncbi:MAG: hypothetical protein QXM08_00680 [Thermofilaceae archaeon]
MTIRELWRARVEGRFGLKHYLIAWAISARLFAVPWVALFTLFGALLAGVESVERAVASCIIAAFVLIASHFNNNYKDVELGVDRYVNSVEEAERICSTLKPYTAAAWIVPLRITGVKFQKANELLFTALAILTYLCYFTNDLGILIVSSPFLILGIAVGRLYTSFFKPMRLGEVAVFLGHGFGTVTFGFLSQRPDVLTAVLAGIPTGLISGLAYSVDQFVDLRTDFVKKVRSIYESWFNSRMPLGLYVLVLFAFWVNVVVAWVVAGIYPRGTLAVLALIPFVLFVAPKLEYDREGGLKAVALIATFLVPALMCVGALIC